ncbi:hypothetical protein [Bacillus toyonensis]|uniref:hypothetical protein n=1 Tax=Bacillus toyonensis TaxID=155322 RepID=UPI002E2406AB|nr:hypothetical protein [Bacillus toyonensis]
MKVAEYEKMYGEINWDYVQHLFDEEITGFMPYVSFGNCEELYSFYHSEDRSQMEISKIVDDYLKLHMENLRLSFRTIDINDENLVEYKNNVKLLSEIIRCSSLDIYTIIDIKSGKVKNVEAVTYSGVTPAKVEGLSYLKEMGFDISGLEISLAFGADPNYNQEAIRSVLSEWSRVNVDWNVKYISSQIEEVRSSLHRTIAKESLEFK